MPDEEPIVAIPGLPLLHVPPVIMSLNVLVRPIHTEPEPVILPADGVAETVTAQSAVATPHVADVE